MESTDADEDSDDRSQAERLVDDGIEKAERERVKAAARAPRKMN